MEQQLIPFGINAFAMMLCHAYLAICRAIGKEDITTIVTILSYAVINLIAFGICVWVLELGVNSLHVAFIFQFA